MNQWLTYRFSRIDEAVHCLTDAWMDGGDRKMLLMFGSRELYKQWTCIQNARRVKNRRRQKYWHGQVDKWSEKCIDKLTDGHSKRSA